MGEVASLLSLVLLAVICFQLLSVTKPVGFEWLANIPERFFPLVLFVILIALFVWLQVFFFFTLFEFFLF